MPDLTDMASSVFSQLMEAIHNFAYTQHGIDMHVSICSSLGPATDDDDTSDY